jgi:glyoxylase-like metal-dependent hydrolase (beta-lactamase superfamily II)
MPGTWIISRRPSLSIHSFTAPEEGWLANSHVVELSSQMFVVDAQYTLPLAREVARYAAKLNKPLSRLYVSHYHPDHLLGAAAFDAPLYTFPVIADKMVAVGDRVAAEEHEKIGDAIPSKARRADHHIEEGEELLDGVRVVHRRLRGAETEDALVIALPDAGAIIVQDLVYHLAHPFLGERRFDSWKAALREYRDLPFELVLPGHGLPGGAELYDGMLEYLDFAEDALKKASDAADFKRRVLERFPDYDGVKIVDHQLRFLFR